MSEERFELVIPGPPVSQQARDRERQRQWRERVRKAAEDVGVRLEAPGIRVGITYFRSTESGWIDVDNIPKLILDGLKGVLFDNDRQVRELVSRATEIDQLHASRVSPLLAMALMTQVEFVHIVVEPLDSWEADDDRSAS